MSAAWRFARDLVTGLAILLITLAVIVGGMWLFIHAWKWVWGARAEAVLGGCFALFFGGLLLALSYLQGRAFWRDLSRRHPPGGRPS